MSLLANHLCSTGERAAVARDVQYRNAHEDTSTEDHMIGRTLAVFSGLTLGAWPVAALVPLAVGVAVAHVVYRTLNLWRTA